MLVVGPVLLASGAKKRLRSSYVYMHQLLNPGFLDAKISTLSLRINTVSAVRSHATNSEWYTRRGLFYLLKGDQASAQKDFTSAVEHNANNYTALYYLTCIALKTCDPRDYGTVILQQLERTVEAFDATMKQRADEEQQKSSVTSTIKGWFHKAEDSLSSLHDEFITLKGGFFTMMHTNAVSNFFNPQLTVAVKEYAQGNERAMKNVFTMVSTPITRTHIVEFQANILCRSNEYAKAAELYLDLIADVPQDDVVSEKDSSTKDDNEQQLHGQSLLSNMFNLATCFLYLKQFEKAKNQYLLVMNYAASRDYTSPKVVKIQQTSIKYLQLLRYYFPEELNVQLMDKLTTQLRYSLQASTGSEENQENEENNCIIPYRFLGEAIMTQVAVFLPHKEIVNVMAASKELKALMYTVKPYVINEKLEYKLRRNEKSTYYKF